MMHGRGKSNSAIVAVKLVNKAGRLAAETFQFLGFTFICGQSRRGRFLLKRKSRGDRMRTKLKEVKEEMRWRRHQPVREQGKWLGQVVRGFFAYHAVPTNTRALNTFRHRVLDLWRRSLKRRSQRDRYPGTRMSVDPVYKVARSGARVEEMRWRIGL